MSLPAYENGTFGNLARGLKGVIEYPFVCNLTPHPLNEKIYGRENLSPELIESIAKLGVLEPLLVDKNRRVLSGHRRLAATLHLKVDQIPVIYFKGSDVEAERLIIESNRQREKTPEQKAREFTELKRIEAALAKERQGTRTDIRANLPQGSVGKARDKAAAKVGMKPRTAEKLEKLVKVADAGNVAARAALDEVNAGKKSAHAATKEIAGEKQPINGPSWSQKTPHGHKVNNALSALHKYLRRGDADNAMYFAAQICLAFTNSYGYTAVWNTLNTVASEDIGTADVDVCRIVRSLFENFKDAKGSDRGRLFVTHAVFILAHAGKSRMIDHATIVHFEGANAKRKLPRDSQDPFESKKVRSIPEFALVGHPRTQEEIETFFKNENEGIEPDPYMKQAKSIRVAATKQKAA